VNQKPNEEVDFYFLNDGRLVFTESYHLKRGFCCGSGCKHCPYEYVNVPKALKDKLLRQKSKDEY
jgi:hypothetical protein